MSNATYRVTDYEDYAQRTVTLCPPCEVHLSMDLCLTTEHLLRSIQRCEMCGALPAEDMSDEDELIEDDLIQDDEFEDDLEY